MTSIHIICAQHNQTAIVGPGTALEELECVTCIGIADGEIRPPAPTDPEELFISKITRHDGGNCCCGSCEPDFCFNCGHYSQFCTCWKGATVYSLNYCDHTPGEPSYLCHNERAGVQCKHPECTTEPPF